MKKAIQSFKNQVFIDNTTILVESVDSKTNDIMIFEKY